MEKLRNGYEQAKAENMKLKDNLETQNKLWEIWLQKFDQGQNQEVHITHSENSVLNVKTDDKVLLSEDEDID